MTRWSWSSPIVSDDGRILATAEIATCTTGRTCPRPMRIQNEALSFFLHRPVRRIDVGRRERGQLVSRSDCEPRPLYHQLTREHHLTQSKGPTIRSVVSVDSSTPSTGESRGDRQAMSLRCEGLTVRRPIATIATPTALGSSISSGGVGGALESLRDLILQREDVEVGRRARPKREAKRVEQRDHERHSSRLLRPPVTSMDATPWPPLLGKGAGTSALRLQLNTALA
jgi:hypothetical protein